MTHGVFKPRNKHLNDILTTRKSGAHEDKAGKHVKRAKAARAFERDVRAVMREFAY